MVRIIFFLLCNRRATNPHAATDWTLPILSSVPLLLKDFAARNCGNGCAAESAQFDSFKIERKRRPTCVTSCFAIRRATAGDRCSLFLLRVNRATFSFCYFREGRRHRRHLLDGLNAAMPQCLFLTWKRQMRRRDPSEVAWQSVIIAMEKHIIVETAALLRKVAFVSLCNSREGNYSGPAGNSKDEDEEEEMKKEQRGSSGYDVSLIGWSISSSPHLTQLLRLGRHRRRWLWKVAANWWILPVSRWHHPRR